MNNESLPLCLSPRYIHIQSNVSTQTLTRQRHPRLSLSHFLPLSLCMSVLVYLLPTKFHTPTISSSPMQVHFPYEFCHQNQKHNDRKGTKIRIKRRKDFLKTTRLYITKQNDTRIEYTTFSSTSIYYILRYIIFPKLWSTFYTYLTTPPISIIFQSILSISLLYLIIIFNTSSSTIYLTTCQQTLTHKATLRHHIYTLQQFNRNQRFWIPKKKQFGTHNRQLERVDTDL